MGSVVRYRVREGTDPVRLLAGLEGGTRIGRGSVLGAHAVARGDIPEYAIAVGAPARVVRDRMADYRAAAAQRAALADIARKTAAAVQARLGATESM